jgi:hypothetical protein
VVRGVIWTGALLALVFIALLTPLVRPGRLVRHAGRLHSVNEAGDVFVIEQTGPDRTRERIEVRAQLARVVRVSRDHVGSAGWLERSTSVHGWPAGTFIVVIGRATSPGVVEATRVSISDLGPA